jgi:class 3 adenylate cyclase/CheY-like chemotaxis protein
VAKRTQILTVLFTDVVDSTSTLSHLDDSSADDLRVRHFAVLRSALAMHHGSEVKSLGDGVMATFDSANDALAAAATMHRGIAFHNHAHPEIRIDLRIGMSAGEVLRGEDGDCFGMPVVEASRLCQMASGDETLATDIVRTLAGAQRHHRLDEIGPVVLKGIDQPVKVWRADWDPADEFSLRVALADDSFLLREGIAHVLEAEGIDVVLQSEDAETLLESLPAARPHVVVIDVRMPPTHTNEGLLAAERILREHPGMGVLVLSHTVDPGSALRLLSAGQTGIGYMLKERIADIGDLTAAIRTVASGGRAIDPEIEAYLAEHRAC